MTARKCTGYGLIAGLTLAETLASPPGLVMDLYIMRRNYDDEQHHIRRKSLYAWEDDE